MLHQVCRPHQNTIIEAIGSNLNFVDSRRVLSELSCLLYCHDTNVFSFCYYITDKQRRTVTLLHSWMPWRTVISNACTWSSPTWQPRRYTLYETNPLRLRRIYCHQRRWRTRAIQANRNNTQRHGENCAIPYYSLASLPGVLLNHPCLQERSCSAHITIMIVERSMFNLPSLNPQKLWISL